MKIRRPEASAVNGHMTRAGLAVAGLLDSALPPIRRRRAAAKRYRTPTAGAMAPAVPTTFEATAADGTPTQIVATASPGNQISGAREPAPREYQKEPEPAGTLSIAEGSGHPAGQRGRPITWVIVGFIMLAFLTAGLGLVFDLIWLFAAGLAAVVAGVAAGWAFGIMADVTGSERASDEQENTVAT